MKHFSSGGSRSVGGLMTREEPGGRVIVFVNAIGEARRLANLLRWLQPGATSQLAETAR